ncbi:lipoprotein transporter ATP-binding subunit [Phycisphaerae bacterium RAS2]|nr:lipoprotein transporter ATP-binding subunit [Phycisphaerae bacterium RAS2]
MHEKIDSAAELHLRVIREPAVTPMSPRKRAVCWDFGIPPHEPPHPVADDLRIACRPGTITALVGPSGSGKSSLLNALAEELGRVAWVGREKLDKRSSIIDLVAPRRPLATAMRILTACGLGEPRLWVRSPEDLSDGERFRAALARAIGRAVGCPAPAPILCDEFTAILHRRLARALACNLRKLVSRTGLTLFVATTHEDILEDLQPNQLVRLGAEPPRVETHLPRLRRLSLHRRLVVEPGSVRDYSLFSAMHYRHRDGLGFVDKVFLLREQPGGEPLGILVFAHGPMELALRNQSTGGRFVRNLRRLNRELRVLRRLVMHPDVRGCGLGHVFVRRTLPLVGVRFIECLAAMGTVNPVFERAGMHRIGQCALPRGRLAILERLRRLKLDPFSDAFTSQIAKYPRVRRLVVETILGWSQVTHSAKGFRLRGRSPDELGQTFRQVLGEPPVYYLWDRDGEFPREGSRSEPQDRERATSPPARRAILVRRKHDPRD